MRKRNIYYIHFDSINSTNTWAKQQAHTFDPHQFTCITALEQTAGRGRFLRQWLSPKGNIYATLYFSLPCSFPHLSNISQVLSLSCCKVLINKKFSPQIKWPNDLLLEEKKVAGILTETKQFKEYTGVVLGIGINVNMAPELLAAIDQPATSLAQLSGHLWELEQILDPLLHQFLDDLDLLKAKGFAPFRQTYENLLAFKGKSIAFNDGNNDWKGTCHSITDEGKLNLLLPSGEMRALSVGEIKFR